MNDPVIERVAREDPATAGVPPEAHEAMLARLRASVEDAAPSPTGQPYQRRRLLIGVAVSILVVAAVAAVAIVAADRHSRSASKPHHPPLSGHGVIQLGTIRSVRAPSALFVGDGSLWAIASGHIVRLDPTDGRVQARIPVLKQGTGDGQLTAGAGSIWVASSASSEVVRIDPSTNRVIARINLGAQATGGGIAYAGGRIWVSGDAHAHGTLVVIDPQTDRLTGPPVKVGTGPATLAAAFGAVWVQNTSQPYWAMSRVDLSTHVVSSLPFAGGPSVGFGSLWVTPEWSSGNHGPGVRRYDPSTRAVTARIRLPRALALAFGAGRVWVVTQPRSRSLNTFQPIRGTATLVQVDPRTDRVTGRPIHLAALQPLSVAVSGDNVWIAGYDSGLLHFRDLP